MNLSNNQKEFYKSALEGKNIFLTGKAGTGKSFIVKKLIKDIKCIYKRKNVVVVAPTGIAANNIGGSTIHSVFGLPIDGMITYETSKKLKPNKVSVIRNMNVLIIDEVSMVRADILDGIHYTMVKNGIKGGLINGDVQIILIGDLAQLKPPVSKSFESVLFQKYKGIDFTYSDVFEKTGFKTIDLTEVLRQSDNEFIENLNLVRENGKAPYFKKFIDNKERGVILCPHNDTVAMYNQKGLDSIDSELCTYEAIIEGNLKPVDFNLENLLHLKDGCKVMYLVNNPELGLFNGSVGTVSIRSSKHKPVFMCDKGSFELVRVEFEKKEYVYDDEKGELVLETVGTIKQYPIKLAYALSIHKSQGMTFEECTIDLSRPCFAEGQLYVALSRVKSPEGLSIIRK